MLQNFRYSFIHSPKFPTALSLKHTTLIFPFPWGGDERAVATAIVGKEEEKMLAEKEEVAKCMKKFGTRRALNGEKLCMSGNLEGIVMPRLQSGPVIVMTK